MIPVSYPDIVETFKRAMFDILNLNFDGQVHRYGDINLAFPLARIEFHLQQNSRPMELTIAVLGDTVLNEEHEKCNLAEKHGYEIRAVVQRSVIIAAPYEGGEERGKAAQLVDITWARLHNLTTMGVALFSARNIHGPQLSTLPDEITRDINIIEASGTFTAQIRAKYTAYSLT